MQSTTESLIVVKLPPPFHDDRSCRIGVFLRCCSPCCVWPRVRERIDLILTQVDMDHPGSDTKCKDALDKDSNGHVAGHRVLYKGLIKEC